MTTSRPLAFRVAAVAGAAALVVSGAQAAHAQSTIGATGNVDLGSVQFGGANGVHLGSAATPATPTPGTPATPADDSGSLSTGSLDADSPAAGSIKAYGQNPITGSLIKNADATGTGSIDTSGSALIGEPTFGSLASTVETALGSNFSNPATGTGSVDTTGSLGEPTTGSLAPLTAALAGSLGTDTGITSVITPGSLEAGSLNAGSSVLGETGVGSLGVLLPLVVVGGSIAAGIAAAPAIQDAINNLMPKPAPAPAPAAPGPNVDNGRG